MSASLFAPGIYYFVQAGNMLKRINDLNNEFSWECITCKTVCAGSCINQCGLKFPSTPECNAYLSSTISLQASHDNSYSNGLGLCIGGGLLFAATVYTSSKQCVSRFFDDTVDSVAFEKSFLLESTKQDVRSELKNDTRKATIKNIKQGLEGKIALLCIYQTKLKNDLKKIVIVDANALTHCGLFKEALKKPQESNENKEEQDSDSLDVVNLPV